MVLSTVRALIWVALGGCLTGCILPEFENGPAPSTTGPTDSGTPSDGPGEWTPIEDVANEPNTDAADAPDVDAAEDVVEVEAGFCEANPNGTVCGVGDACHEMLCESGLCVAFEIPDGVECAAGPNACWKPGTCQDGICGTPTARADGYNWDPADTHRRCCGGQALRMDTKSNCGVCGIQCDSSDGQSCKLNAVNGRYYCEGCNASAKCWSGCCSTSYGQPYRCAASDCSGGCIACPGGASCQTSSQASNVCAY